MTMVYLGGPIDLVNEGTRTAWRDAMKKQLMKHGISSFDPAAAFNVDLKDADTCEALVEINRVALLNCDYAIFVMGKNYPSVGTPIELYMSKTKGIKNIVIYDPNIMTFATDVVVPKLPASFPAYVTVFSDHITNSFATAISKIASDTGNASPVGFPLGGQLHGIPRPGVRTSAMISCNLGDIDMSKVVSDDE